MRRLRVHVTLSSVVLALAGCTSGGRGPAPVSTAPAARSSDQPAPLRMIDVHDAAELTRALANARAGDAIHLADGTYAGQFKIVTSGTAQAPITLYGSRQAVIDGEGTNKGRTIELTASYWRLQGFTITNGQKGLMALGAQHTVVDGLLVHAIGDEAIHFRDNSSDNIIRNSEVRDTGLRRPEYGEAIYLGQAVSNWTNGPDRSDRNKVLNNVLGPGIAAEDVDVKEGTTGGEVRGNVFDGRGQAGENSGESWVNVKGNDYVIADNKGTAAYASGFKTRVEVDGWGCGNTFRGNTGSVAPYRVNQGWAFDIHGRNAECEGHENVVCADNTVQPGGAGFSNVPTVTCPAAKS
ncbi:right-handed parallel beta-helix repeat-containing protein [Dactylosporangium sp. NPDC048998]|uniref:right-handed parallel beta-helix repeat-containing protein n=1 Tax=Dactylosporangium sp. NPDC048998 TaxID=3363976 RepID=UPI003714B5F1